MNNTTEVLLNLLLCGVLGVVGQGIRVIVGLKKLRDATQNPVPGIAPPVFNGRKLWLSLFIGFIAGALAYLSKIITTKNVDVNTQSYITILAAGYAGVDFIEGVFKL